MQCSIQTSANLHAASTTTTSGTTGNGAAAGPAEDPAIKHMADLLDSIPQELLACAAAHCGEGLASFCSMTSMQCGHTDIHLLCIPVHC